MPATHLINVDLPAPLSPTSAITSPSRTSKSTSCSACTDPKLFETPRSSSVVAGVAFTERFLPRWRRSEERLHREGLLLAVLRVLAGERDLAEPLRLEGGDHGAGEPVVGGEDAVDLVVVTNEHLVEDRASLRRAPVGVLVA